MVDFNVERSFPNDGQPLIHNEGTFRCNRIHLLECNVQIWRLGFVYFYIFSQEQLHLQEHWEGEVVVATGNWLGNGDVAGAWFGGGKRTCGVGLGGRNKVGIGSGFGSEDVFEFPNVVSCIEVVHVGQHMCVCGSNMLNLHTPVSLTWQKPFNVLQESCVSIQNVVSTIVLMLYCMDVIRSSVSLDCGYWSKNTPPPFRTPLIVTCGRARHNGLTLKTILFRFSASFEQHVKLVSIHVFGSTEKQNIPFELSMDFHTTSYGDDVHCRSEQRPCGNTPWTSMGSPMNIKKSVWLIMLFWQLSVRIFKPYHNCTQTK